MDINVSVVDGNNIVCQVTPTPQQVITIDRGVAGVGIESITPVTIATLQYLRITYTNGVVQDVGPLTSTAYFGETPILITGNTISLTTVPVSLGGTGQTTATAGFNALAPTQTGNSGKFLTTDGTNASWSTNPLGTVTSVNASGGTTGLTFSGGPITTSGTLTLAGILAVANGGTGVTTSTGSGNNVLSTAPILSNPTISNYEAFTPSSAPTYAEGLMWYDSSSYALAYYNNTTNNIVHIGQEIQQQVRNSTGSTITKGSVVYISGATGQIGNVILAQANAYVSSQVIGIANQDIPNNTNGWIVTQGTVSNINTSAFTAGNPIYLSATTAGALTQTEPSTPNYAVHMGVCLYSNTNNGKIYISPMNQSIDTDYIIGQVAIAQGGTGQSTANSAFNALAPSQTGNSGKYLTTDGTNTSWATNPLGTVTSVAQTFTGGLISVAGSPITSSGTLALTVAGTSGGIPYFSSASTWDTSAALSANALMIGGGAGLAPSTITTGTGVVTALGVNTGTAGSFVVNGGALGTPSSGTVTNLTGTASININGTVGTTTPNTGAFTTLSASSAVSGTGFSTYLASPPAIGGTVAAAGSFTTLSASSTLSVTGAGTIQGLTVGRGAGAVSTNTAVGALALNVNTTGAYITAIGNNAAISNTTGSGNTAYGAAALYANTTGSENTAIGGSSATYGALRFNTTGNYNVGVGGGALASNTTASNNTAVGYQAGYSQGAGTSVGANVFLGTQAGYTDTTDAYNVFVGYKAGYSYNANTSGGTFNTFVGPQAGTSVTTGIKNTILGGYSGNQGGLDIRTASNYIVLSDGDGNPRIVNGAYPNAAGSFATALGCTTLGIGGTSTTYDGILYLNGSSASGWGPCLAGRTNGTQSWYVGSYSYIFSGTSQNLTCQTGTNGVQLVSGATAWTSASDPRLKTITGTYENALADIKQIKPIKFTWKADESNRPCVGVDASTVVGVIPEAVDECEAIKGDDTKYLHVRYTELIPLMIASIQQLKAEFDAYKEAHP